jgi:hypothetical protein
VKLVLGRHELGEDLQLGGHLKMVQEILAAKPDLARMKTEVVIQLCLPKCGNRQDLMKSSRHRRRCFAVKVVF